MHNLREAIRRKEVCGVGNRLWSGALLNLSAIALLSGCNEESANKNNGEDEAIKIVTTTAQIGEPLEVIGGDRVDVTSLMGPGVDPHLYTATQGDIKTLSDADMIFYNGLYLEMQMNKVFENINVPAIPIGEAVKTADLLEDEEDETANDPHIWFDVHLWKQALNAAVEELKTFSPDDAEMFEENKQAYFEELEELYTYATEKLAEIPEEKRVLVTAHDAFQYFGQMNNIEVIGLQGLSTEDEVGIMDIQGTIDLVVEKGVPAVFVESSVNRSSIEAVIEGASKAGLDIELGGELFSDAMGEAGTEEGTYIGMYRHNVDTIYDALMRK